MLNRGMRQYTRGTGLQSANSESEMRSRTLIRIGLRWSKSQITRAPKCSEIYLGYERNRILYERLLVDAAEILRLWPGPVTVQWLNTASMLSCTFYVNGRPLNCQTAK